MERSQPRTSSFAGALPPSQIGRTSRPQTIPRKPIPRENAGYSPVAREVSDDDATRFDQVDKSTLYFPPDPASLSTQPHQAHPQHGKFPRTHCRQRNHGSVMAGRLRHITLLCVFLVLPLCGVTIALLIVVYQNLLPHSDLASSEPCSGLVINYGASQLTSLSTWTSTIATILAPAFMALISYPVAKAMTQHSEANQAVKRPALSIPNRSLDRVVGW